MKTQTLITAVFLFISMTFYSQSDLKFKDDKVFKFKVGMEVVPSNVDGSPIEDAAKVIASRGWKVKIDNLINSKNVVVFHFLTWNDDNGNNLKLLTRNTSLVYDSEIGNYMYYTLTIEEFNTYMIVSKAWVEIEFGTVTIPIKIRPGNSDNIPLDFYGNFNAGVGLNFKFRKFIDIYSGISITTVPVDNETTNGVITSPTNAAALTPTFGIIKELGKAQVGVFLGFDFLSRNLGDNWIYQGRRWFGIGVGVNIFDVSTGAEGGSN
jgi:hypothetical protein